MHALEAAMPKKSEEAKAKEILKKRERARKGFREGAPTDAQEKRKQRMQKVGDGALALDLGLKR
jgi:glutamate synthase domain-containing protein 3